MGSLQPLEPLQPLEIAAGMVLEPLKLARRERARRPPRQRAGAARRALESILLEYLSRGATTVSFSGGRDSSLILALATLVARREGLPVPIPVSMRHHSEESKEDEYQQQVIDHLGLREWLRVDVADSMDVLGTAAIELYARCGLLTPPNAYLHLAMTSVAPSGVMLTGGGGDEILGTPPWRLAEVLAGRSRVRWRDGKHMGLALAPHHIRLAVSAARGGLPLPWLSAEAQRQVDRRLAAEETRTRVRWDVGAMLWATSRTRRLADRDLDRVGEDRSVAIRSPLADVRFVQAFAGEYGLAGPRSRDVAMVDLGGDVLPGQIVRRQTKASFGGVIWGPAFRGFVDQWDPSTLRPAIRALIDPEALRAAWREPSPIYSCMMLAQAAWLDHESAS